MHTDPINDIGECEFPAERANARVLATSSNLAKYFRQQKSITITLLIGEIELAECAVDLLPLLSDSSDSSVITPKKIEGSFNFTPVKGNIFGGKSCSSDAALGVSLELEQTALPFKVSRDSPSGDVTDNKVKRVLSHLNDVSLEYESLERKRERDDSNASGLGSLEASRNNSLSFSASRQFIKQQLKPPVKKRKLNEDGDERCIYSEKGEEGGDWAAAEEDLQQWRRAQENIFWKQVCLYTLCNHRKIAR